MLKSMTGFGRALGTENGRTITVEMKSVNNRFLDVDFRLPRSLNYLEDQLKKMIADSIKRGKVYVQVAIDGENVTTKLQVNWALFEEYLLHMNAAAEKYQLGRTMQMTDMLQLPGVLTLDEKPDSESVREQLILQLVNEALNQLVKMRMAEGLNLYEDLQERVKAISGWIGEVRELFPQVIHRYQERLTNKIKEFLDGRFQLDEARLMNEVAIYADKSDITEELLRLNSHVKQFLDIIEERDRKGRKLEFLVQEMNREINTIGSKSNDATLSRYVVTLKSELEKIREQLQNIE